MGVNALIDSAGSQQAAVASSIGTASELRELEKAQSRQSSDRVSGQTSVSKLLQEGVSGSKAGMSILTNLVSNLASSGVVAEPQKYSNKAKQEYENEFGRLNGREDNVQDQVDIQNVIKKVSQNNKNDKKNNKNTDKQVVAADAEIGEAIKDYASLYAQSLTSNSAEIKKKLKATEELLLEKGINLKDLVGIRTKISNTIRKEIAEQIKNALLDKTLATEKTVDFVMKEKALNEVLDYSLLRGLHDNESLQMSADYAAEEVSGKLKDFTREKMEEKLIQKHLSSDRDTLKQIDSDLKEILKLAAKSGLNIEEFANNWKIKKYDIGLFIADLTLGQGQSSMNQDNNKKNNSAYEFSKDDEKDLLKSRLRAIYMHRAITGDWKTMLETHFKMRKLQNGLIKLGVSTNEMKSIEKEGIEAARASLLEMLSETLEERANFYETSGPAYELTSNKIKGVLSNMNRLNFVLDDQEFNSIRDKANIKVFNVAQEEYINLKGKVTDKKNLSLEKRLSQISKLMNRLKEESKIPYEFPIENPTIMEAV